MSDTRIRLLGTPCIEHAGHNVTVRRRAVLALIAYMAATGETHEREALLALLWPERATDAARNELRRTLSLANQVLDGVLLVTRQTVVLAPEQPIWVDRSHFLALLAGCAAHAGHAVVGCALCTERAAAAIALYRGDFLAGFTLPASAPFEEWQLFESELLRRQMAHGLTHLADAYEAAGEMRSAIEVAVRWTSLEPLDEAAHRRLMSLYGRSGQREAALRQYQHCARLLDLELALAPQAETTRLYEQIQRGTFPTVRAAAAPHLSPEPTTLFVGRERELAELTRLLGEPTCRLLTVTGLGGIGKTRLVQQLLIRQATHFSDGTCFVPLAAVEHVTLLAPTILNALGRAPEGSSDARAYLISYLQSRRLLLVLDNVEQLTGIADEVSSLLRAAPHIKLLVTSREPLHLQEEWRLELGGLDFPAGAEEFDEGHLARYSALQLYLQRARQLDRDLPLDLATRAALVRLCQMVGGMPLALELAAGWAGTLTPGELVAEIEQDLGVLGRPLQDLPERHHSVQSLLAQSWGRLPAGLRGSLLRLALFRGGFQREAAAAVAGASLGDLRTLVERGLLYREATGRYELHELLRQYALQQLAVDEEALHAALDCHSAYFADWTAARESLLRGGGQQAATLAELRREIQNLRAGWEWSVAQRLGERLARYSEGFALFLEMQSWFEEGATRFGAARDGADKVLGVALAIRHALFAFYLGHHEPAQIEFEAALVEAEQLGVETDVALALDGLGRLARVRGAVEEAADYHERALARWRALGEQWRSAACLHHLGALAAVAGHFDEAAAHYEESLTQRRALGDEFGMAQALYGLGSISYSRGDLASAARLYGEALGLQEAIGDRRGIAKSHYNLGGLAATRGDYKEAERHHRRSYVLAREIGDRWAQAGALRSLADLARAQGRYSVALQFAEESLALAQALGERRGALVARLILSEVERERGESARALRWAEQGLAEAQGDRWARAYALLALGEAARTLEQGARARSSLEEAHALAEEMGDRPLAALAHAALGAAARDEGEAVQARAHWQAALTLAWEMQGLPLVLRLLIEIATLLDDAGETQLAAAARTLARTHPASEYVTRMRAGESLSRIELTTLSLGVLVPTLLVSLYAAPEV